jgi:16S rRNA (guanine966-N2)-methyltransferase
VFIDSSREVARGVRENLRTCGFEDQAKVLCAPWATALRRLEHAGDIFDVVFLDPPYDWQGGHECLASVAAAGLLADDGLAILEHRTATPPEPAPAWELHRCLRVGDTSFSLFGILEAP